jgi:hypothetical protein
VRVKVTDSNGLTGTQTMRISVSTQSVMTSSLNCPQNQSVVTSRDVTGNCTAVIDWTEAETSSLCAQSLLTYAFTGATAGTGSGLIPATQAFEKGSTTVTYTLPGQTPTTCSFTVTVTDDEAPTVTCPGASSNGLSGGSCSMAVSGLNATYSDNCTGSTLAYALSGATTATGSGQATGSTFQAGITTVKYTVTDAVGNTATCPATVTVTVLPATVGTTDNSGARSFFNTNTWRFCDSVHVFLNPSSPWGWPQAKTYNSVNGVFNRTSFRATKKGDVSQSNSRPDSDPVSLMIPSGELPFDQESEVVLSLSGLRDMRALQAALKFDPEILELTGISTEKSAVGLTEEGVGLYDSRAGVIRLVWAAAEPLSVPDGSEFVRLRFRALKSTSTPVSDLLTLIEESDLTPSAYDADYAAVALQVVESEKNNHLVERSGNTPGIQLLSVAPNPFSGYTAVRFMMPEPGIFTVNLYSADGRLVWSHSRPQLAGYGEVEITEREAPLPGVYYLEIVGAGMRERVRLVRM